MKGNKKQYTYSFEEEHTGYSDGAFREVDVYETFVVKRPKTDDSEPEFYTYFSWYKGEGCENCPFKERCSAFDRYHYEYEGREFEQELEKFEKEVAEYFDNLEDQECCGFCGGIEHNGDYIDPKEGQRCCEKEYNIWCDFEGHRGGLCDVLDFDEYSYEVVMRRAEICGEKYTYGGKEYKQSRNLQVKGTYNRKTQKWNCNRFQFKGCHLSKKQRREFKKLVNYAAKHKLINEPSYFNILKFAALHGYDWKPLAKTFKYANEIDFYFEDLHDNNWGFIGKRVVLTDFGGYDNY